MRPMGLALIFNNSQDTVSTASTGCTYMYKQITEDSNTQPLHLLGLPTVITKYNDLFIPNLLAFFNHTYSAISNI